MQPEDGEHLQLWATRGGLGESPPEGGGGQTLVGEDREGEGGAGESHSAETSKVVLKHNTHGQR